MADGTSVPVGVMTPAMAGRRRASTMKRFAQRRSTIAFLLCLPLILLIAAFVIYPAFYAIYLSMLNKKMTAVRRAGQFRVPAEAQHLPAGHFPELPVRGHRGGAEGVIGFILAHLMHNIPGKNQRIWRGLLLVPWVIPLALSTLDLVVDVRPVLFGVQLDPEPVRLANVPWLGVGWIARDLHHHGECLVRHAVLHDHVSRGAEIGAGAAV